MLEKADRGAIEAFLAAHADPVDDLLLYADVTPPLGELSMVWRHGTEALAFAFPMWPETPALGVKGVSAAAEAAMLASGVFTHGYVICPLAQRPLWEAAGVAETGHRELHMTVKDWEPAERPGVRDAGLAELDAFYRELGAGAWNPAQFQTGPFVVVEEEGRILAAAGTHFAYGQLAQVGNVLTRPEARGRGLATLCTAAVVDRLVARGHAVISLFVAEENHGARRIYERLGFETHRTLAAFGWRASPERTRPACP